MVYLVSALIVHCRGQVRFGLIRALTDFTVLLAPVNVMLYFFSQVPRSIFIETDQFPQLEILQANWCVIRDEAMSLAEQGQIQVATGYNDIGFNSFFRTGWKRFYLSWYGTEMPSALMHCPRTMSLIRQVPLIKAAMFASLPPGAMLVRHRDPYAGSLRYHLGLLTPNNPDCFIEVDGQRYFWRDGEAMMFDETLIHHAANHTIQQRIVLFCDIERPLRFSLVRLLNRCFAHSVMAAATSQNVAGEAVGSLNHFFRFAYQARVQAKKLKLSHRNLYYAGKWLLILSLLWVVFW
jgi:beta-hydroxylase